MMNRKPWSVLLAGVAILLVILGLLWLTFDAVGSLSFLDTSSAPVRLALTPNEVFEELKPAAAFDTISQDFADVLAVPISAIQVRTSSGGCAACEMKENPMQGFLPIANVAEQVAESDRVWLIQSDMMCFYLVDNEQWHPKLCSIWP